MVDFKKRLGTKDTSSPINPFEIYEKSDRAVDKGPLRPGQMDVLDQWFRNHMTSKDVIVKLHTGQGKTLVGLLMLQSLLNQKRGPAVYLCPDNFLVEQTHIQARQFGIHACTTEDELPEEFLNSSKILITSVQKMFNGLTKFGLGRNPVDVGAVLMDDSHSCADSIKEACRIKIPKTEPAYDSLKTLFSSYLESQGAGTYADIENGKRDAILPVPYWAWEERKIDVARILSRESDKKSIKFAWPLLKDYLEHCSCVVSGEFIEIEARVAPIDQFSSFWKARNRIFMSATVTDDSFLIKGLQLSPDTIQNPLHYSKETWSGEKMLLLPSLIDESLYREAVVPMFARPNPKRSGGVIAITPGFRWTKDWEGYGSIVAKKDNLNSLIESLKGRFFTNTLVFANRYDGIDLPDDVCRILIVDSKPFSENLVDQYEESCRPNSDGIYIKTLRSIEQGMGRSVRGEKDYSVIIAIGSNLVKILRDPRSRKFLSSQMDKQIEIGIEVAALAKDEIAKGENPVIALFGLINQCLGRDVGWKDYYAQEMGAAVPRGANPKILKMFEIELEAEKYFISGNYSKAVSTLQAGLDRGDLDKNDLGWYLQEMARYKYRGDKTVGMQAQLGAYQVNSYLLKPPGSITVSKITLISHQRMARIKNWIKQFKNYEELNIQVEDILSRLNFGVKADDFEQAIQDLSVLLGFEGERPDKKWKEGPDNLWAVDDNNYILWECKNEVDLTRVEINKRESEQMNRSAAWFEKHYATFNVTRIMIHPAYQVESAANFTHEVRILRQKELEIMKKNIASFCKSFEGIDFNSVSEEHLQKLVDANKLKLVDFVNNTKEIKHNKK